MSYISSILDLIYPPRCIFCRKPLLPDETGFCRKCSEALPVAIPPLNGNFFTKCCVALTYSDDIRQAILRFKFYDRPEYAPHFGKLLANEIQKQFSQEYDIISWVPVNEKRLRKRGYDQALLLATSAAACLDTTVLQTLRKSKDNQAQSSLSDAKQRGGNVLGVYEAVNQEQFSGRRVLLIDDIITTGSTLNEAARTLLKAGADSVLAAALAHPETNNTQKDIGL